jgi:hypothetical protein
MVTIMGTRGGKQPGAGRPKGSMARRNQETIEKAKASGLMPLDIMLNDMRYFYNESEIWLNMVKGASPEAREDLNKEFKQAMEYRGIARECAQMAAPYLHPKLSSVDANVNVTNVEAELAELE